MMNLFEPAALQHFAERIEKLTPATTAQWGKMNVAQMLAHCTVALEKSMSTTEPAPRNLFSKIMGPLFKGMLTNDKPYKPGTPTSPEFVMLGQDKDFATEKMRLLTALNRFSTGGADVVSKYPHPFFGKMSVDEWNRSQSKHLNHHLTQFGV